MRKVSSHKSSPKRRPPISTRRARRSSAFSRLEISRGTTRFIEQLLDESANERDAGVGVLGVGIRFVLRGRRFNVNREGLEWLIEDPTGSESDEINRMREPAGGLFQELIDREP